MGLIEQDQLKVRVNWLIKGSMSLYARTYKTLLMTRVTNRHDDGFTSSHCLAQPCEVASPHVQGPQLHLF